MSRTNKRFFLGKVLVRGLLLAAAATIIPSCGSSGGGDSFQDLFIDDFDAGLGAWTIVSPSVTIDSTGIGRGPAMLVAAQAGVPAEAKTTATFSIGPGLTVSVDVLPGSSIAEFFIVDAANPTLRDTYVRIEDVAIHFSIQGQVVSLGVPADPHAHKYLFHVEGGHAQWQRDGITHAQGTFSPASVFLDCRDLDTGSKFDLVHVSTP